MTTHEEQQRIWDEEHRNPTVLLQMDSDKISSGVARFHAFLKQKGLHSGRGIEMGCGKGRNVIGLAREGYDMTGLDFSPFAIHTARKRADKAGVSAEFVVHDATNEWPFASDSFDFAIDCFGSTDIVEPEGRKFALQEMRRILKPGGLMLAYLLSTEDGFHKEMIERSPAGERNAFTHETGKFEKTYDEADIADTYQGFDIIEKRRVEKTDIFKGKEYASRLHWVVFQKPVR